MNTTKDKYNRKAVYTGRRLENDGKVYQRFELLPDHSEIFFRRVRSVWIGHTYKCADSKISLRPERTDDDRIDNPEWEGFDAIVDAHNAKRRAEAKLRAKLTPSLKAAIVALKPLMRGKAHFERRAIIEYLADKSRNLK